MKCKFGTMWLTGTPWQEDCGEVVWDGSQAVDLQDLFQAKTPYLMGMDNVVESLPIPVQLELTDELQALRYVAEIRWNLPNGGPLLLEEEVNGRKLSILYPWAVCHNVQRRRTGGGAVELLYQFTVTGPPDIGLIEPFTRVTEDGQGRITEDGQTRIIE